MTWTTQNATYKCQSSQMDLPGHTDTSRMYWANQVRRTCFILTIECVGVIPRHGTRRRIATGVDRSRPRPRALCSKSEPRVTKWGNRSSATLSGRNAHLRQTYAHSQFESNIVRLMGYLVIYSILLITFFPFDYGRLHFSLRESTSVELGVQVSGIPIISRS